MARQKRQHLKRRKDGRFCCTYHGIQFMGDTEQAALDKREAYKRAERSGSMHSSVTVGSYAVKWLPLYKGSVSVKCYNDYAKQIEALIKAIGNKLFSEVTVDDAKRVYQHYQGYSQSTIKRARMLYISLFDTAMENGFCSRNVFRSKFAQPDRGTEGSHRIITQEERELILTTQHRMRLPALVMLYAGLRRGEAAAILLERDIDLGAGVIRVRNAVRYDSNTPITTTTKTASGRRDVPIFPVLAEELKGKTGWLVHSVDGKQASGTAYARGWQSYMTALSKAAGHPVKIRCHDLRHTFCTMLRDSGVDMKLAMQWMGHSDEKMILRIYDHVTDERVAENTERVSKRLLSMQNHMQND